MINNPSNYDDVENRDDAENTSDEVERGAANEADVDIESLSDNSFDIES